MNVQRALLFAFISVVGVGAFAAETAAPATPPTNSTVESTTTNATTTTPPSTPPTTTQKAAHPKGLRCDACHTTGGWTPAKFAHERTEFPLVGRHSNVACTSCHVREWSEPVPQNCAGCHIDPHAQEFGLRCRSCHNEEGWQPLFLVDAHRRTQFPLSGRHATLPCEECHVEKRERGFTRTALACAACHSGNAVRASASTLDHRALSTACQTCHVPTSFTPARLAAHEVCFPVAATVHAAVRCTECHAQGALAGARLDGDCRGVTVRCADCHVHAKNITDRQHKNVVGYVHASASCAGCHQSVR